MYLIGVAGIRTFKFASAQETWLFKTVSFLLVCLIPPFDMWAGTEP